MLYVKYIDLWSKNFMVSRETSKKGKYKLHQMNLKEVHLESGPINKMIWSVSPFNDITYKQQKSIHDGIDIELFYTSSNVNMY